jgi:3',5'-cyclic AMP phosphodiesterase CpdA
VVIRPTTILQCSDVHFGRDADLVQVAALEALAGELSPDAIAIAGDLTQRARHGEFQRALVFVDAMRRVAPTLVVPGNHDVEWWTTPFGVLGAAPKYVKYRRYFGDDLTPSLVLDRVVLCGALTSYGVAAGSMTYNLNDMAVKGHLPAGETERVRELFLAEPEHLLRVVVMHQNVLRGEISRRMGLARWRGAWRNLMNSGADLVLCGHDHQEGAGTLPNGTVVSTSSTHTRRTRGGRPSACNVVFATDETITVQHRIWDARGERFLVGPEQVFPRVRRASAVA